MRAQGHRAAEVVGDHVRSVEAPFGDEVGEQLALDAEVDGVLGGLRRGAVAGHVPHVDGVVGAERVGEGPPDGRRERRPVAQDDGRPGARPLPRDVATAPDEVVIPRSYGRAAVARVETRSKPCARAGRGGRLARPTPIGGRHGRRGPRRLRRRREDQATRTRDATSPRAKRRACRAPSATSPRARRRPRPERGATSARARRSPRTDAAATRTRARAMSSLARGRCTGRGIPDGLRGAPGGRRAGSLTAPMTRPSGATHSWSSRAAGSSSRA